MFKPTLGNLWDYIVDEGCLRTDCGTEEYLIKWNGQHRVPVKLDEISGGATKYGITLPPQWADKEVTLIEDLPFDEKSIFMLNYSNGPTLEYPFDTSDQMLYFEYVDEQTGDTIKYGFPILGYNTDYTPYYSSLCYPDEFVDWSNIKNGEIKMIIDFFGKPVLLTYLKAYYDEENHQQEWDTLLDSQGNPLKPKFSNFSFDDTTVKGFESLHFEIDGIKFNMNPHHPYFQDGFKFDDEDMEQKDGIDYNAVLRLAQNGVQNILEDNMNYYSIIWNRYKAGPGVDGVGRWLQGADIYGGKIIDVYDKALNQKLLINPDAGYDQPTLIENMFGLIYGDKTIIEEHTYCTASFVVGDKSITPEPMKGLSVTISDESNYQSVPSVEGDAELTLIDNVLSSLTNEQKYSLFLIFERLSFNRDLQTLILPRETLESEESFRRFIVSLLSDEWEIIDQR